MVILPLNERHDRLGFDCGNDDLNHWLARVARQHKDKRVSSTYVGVENETSAEVLGYYAISIAELVNVDLPELYRKKLPMKVPAFRLGRLAVALSHRRKRIGETLLFDAIERISRIAEDIGGVGLVVNSKT